MADYSHGGAPPPPPMMGLHTGRIPSFKNTHGENFQTRCAAEPPACVQNAMMTKDKKPFTYTPGGLDLSQIKTPSMARRLNRQQQQAEDQENPAYFRQPSVNGGPPGPPPPPPPPCAPPPPPPLVINVSAPAKQVAEGERPEIVIPDNPIGMLRKTNSPYHWEAEQSDRINQGLIPKFVDKSATPSPVGQQMRKPPPQQFYQTPPQQYTPPVSNQNIPQQTSRQVNQVQQNNQSPASPIWKPEPKYPGSPQGQNTSSPLNCTSPNQQHTPTKDTLQRQDSQFNLSPSPWGKESPFPNSSSSNTTSTGSNQTVSPNYDTQSSAKSVTPISSPASPWRQQDTRNSPYNQEFRNVPNQFEVISPPIQQHTNQMSPSQGIKSPNYAQSTPSPRSNNSADIQQQNVTPWRQPNVSPNAQQNQVYNNSNQSSNAINNQTRSPCYPQNLRQGNVRYPSPPKQNYQQQNSPSNDGELRFQTHMTIPVTPRKVKNDQRSESVESPKETLPWVRGENTINKSIPAPPWCQRSESRKSLPRDTQEQTDNSSPVQPPWNQRPSEVRKSLPKEVVYVTSPIVCEPQPPWVTENRRFETLPRANQNKAPAMPTSPEQIVQNVRRCDTQGRVIPIQMEMNKQEVLQNNGHGGRNQQQPQLRIIIDMNQQGQPTHNNMQGPQQHIARVLTPQLMRMDGATVCSPVRHEPPPNNVSNQPRTRIIPIQMEPSSPGVTSPRIIIPKVVTDGPPRQSRAFRVLQTITGTVSPDMIQDIEENHGFTDL